MISHTAMNRRRDASAAETYDSIRVDEVNLDRHLSPAIAADATAFFKSRRSKRPWRSPDQSPARPAD